MSNKKNKRLETNQQVYEKIGKQLKALRLKAGYSSAEKFAYEIEIGRTQYGNYERGQDMKISSLLRILAFHQLPIEDFFTSLQ